MATGHQESLAAGKWPDQQQPPGWKAEIILSVCVSSLIEISAQCAEEDLFYRGNFNLFVRLHYQNTFIWIMSKDTKSNNLNTYLRYPSLLVALEVVKSFDDECLEVMPLDGHRTGDLANFGVGHSRFFNQSLTIWCCRVPVHCQVFIICSMQPLLCQLIYLETRLWQQP